MATIMICLMNLNFTGAPLHEILGIGVFFLFLFHKLLNFKWIKAITKNLLGNTVSTKTKVMYAVDVILLVLVTLNVVTGILISTYVLTDITAKDIGATSHLHHVLAYMLAATLIVHVGFHWAFVRTALRIKKDSFWEKATLCFITAVLVLVVSESNLIKRGMPPKKETNESHQEDISESTKTDEDDKSRPEENIENGEGTENNQPTTDPDIPTLKEYLSRLFCTGCGRRCLLTSPDCMKGRREQQQMVQEYNQTYGTDESYSSSNNKRH